MTALGRPEPDESSPRTVERPSPPGTPGSPSSTPTGGTTSTLRSPRIRWAQLFARSYEVLPLLRGEIRVIALINTVQRILLHLDLPHRPPRVTSARAPQVEFEFDQSLPADWDT